MDPRTMQARELHRQAAQYERAAAQFRARRDELIRELHASGVSYQALATAIGCSKELIAVVVKRRVGPGTRGRRRVDRGSA